MASSSDRREPNILITGTPGVGKSLTSRILSEKTGFEWLEVNKIAAEHNCFSSFDEVYQCPILNEDKLLDCMESLMTRGRKIVEYHGAEFFPERWFDFVIVLRTDITLLHDRLTERNYTGKKLRDNIDSEIFQVILEEAMDSYKEDIVHELVSNTEEQVNENVNKICKLIEEWKMNS